MLIWCSDGLQFRLFGGFCLWAGLIIRVSYASECCPSRLWTQLASCQPSPELRSGTNRIRPSAACWPHRAATALPWSACRRVSQLTVSLALTNRCAFKNRFGGRQRKSPPKQSINRGAVGGGVIVAVDAKNDLSTWILLSDQGGWWAAQGCLCHLSGRQSCRILKLFFFRNLIEVCKLIGTLKSLLTAIFSCTFSDPLKFKPCNFFLICPLYCRRRLLAWKFSSLANFTNNITGFQSV